MILLDLWMRSNPQLATRSPVTAASFEDMLTGGRRTERNDSIVARAERAITLDVLGLHAASVQMVFDLVIGSSLGDTLRTTCR